MVIAVQRMESSRRRKLWSGDDGLVRGERRLGHIEVRLAKRARLSPSHTGGGNDDQPRPVSDVEGLRGAQYRKDLVQRRCTPRSGSSARVKTGSSVPVTGLDSVFPLHLWAQRQAR
jgi:hypothetical protein